MQARRCGSLSLEPFKAPVCILCASTHSHEPVWHPRWMCAKQHSNSASHTGTIRKYSFLHYTESWRIPIAPPFHRALFGTGSFYANEMATRGLQCLTNRSILKRMLLFTSKHFWPHIFTHTNTHKHTRVYMHPGEKKIHNGFHKNYASKWSSTLIKSALN